MGNRHHLRADAERVYVPDCHYRCVQPCNIMSWGLSNTLDAQSSIEVIKHAIDVHGKPEILNSDQGSQFTCLDYVELLKKGGIQISMDGKGRALDNIYILYRTFLANHQIPTHLPKPR